MPTLNHIARDLYVHGDCGVQDDSDFDFDARLRELDNWYLDEANAGNLPSPSAASTSFFVLIAMVSMQANLSLTEPTFALTYIKTPCFGRCFDMQIAEWRELDRTTNQFYLAFLNLSGSQEK